VHSCTPGARDVQRGRGAALVQKCRGGGVHVHAVYVQRCKGACAWMQVWVQCWIQVQMFRGAEVERWLEVAEVVESYRVEELQSCTVTCSR